METDERDFIMTRELAYQIIKYADNKISTFNIKVTSFLASEFPGIEIETDDDFDRALRKMNDGQIERLLLKLE